MAFRSRRLGVALVLLVLGGALPAAASDAPLREPALRVALTGKFPPFSFYGPDGALQGFDVDVARAVGAELGREVEVVATEWDGILVGLLLGRYDAIIGSMAVTPERAAKVDFSRPYYVSGPQLFVHRDDAGRISGIADMAGRKVGVGLGETYEHHLRNRHPEVEVVAYKGMPDIFQDLRNRRLDAFLTDRLVGMHQVAAGDMPFVPVGDVLYREEIAIPVRPGADELLREIDAALGDLARRGELAALRAEWFGDPRAGAPEAGAPPAAASAATAEAPRDLAGGPDTTMPTAVIVAKLLRGFAVTLGVATVSIGLGLLVAVPFGWLLHQEPRGLYWLLRSANDFVRATPLLIQLFFVYFGAPQVGVSLAPLEAAVITLGVNAAAYMAEIVRSGLMAVPRGQQLAAEALGLRPLQAFRWVVWPQAFRVALPPLVSSIVALVKDTALISVIAVAEVVREAQSIISVTYDPMRYYLIAAALFFVVTFPLMKLADRLERRIAARGYAR